MGVIAVACVAAVVNSTMLGPLRLAHHAAARADSHNNRVMGMGFIDDTVPPEAAGGLGAAQSLLQWAKFVALPPAAEDESGDDFQTPLQAETGFALQTSGLALSAQLKATAPRDVPKDMPNPPTPPNSPPSAPAGASYVAPPTPEPPVTPPPPVTPDPPVVVPVVVVVTPPPPPPPILTPTILTRDLPTAPPAPIPEPGAWALMLGGVGAIAAVLRRRRRHARQAGGSRAASCGA